MTRYGSGMYDQIEVYDDPEFYHALSIELEKNPDVDASYPIYKAEGIPQIIEIACGFLTAFGILLKLYEIMGKPKKSKVAIRFKNNRLIELDAQGIKELKLIIQDENDSPPDVDGKPTVRKVNKNV